jgi:hypothetical protein
LRLLPSGSGGSTRQSSPRRWDTTFTAKSTCVTALRKGTQEQRACDSRGRSLAYAWLADWSGWRGLAYLRGYGCSAYCLLWPCTCPRRINTTGAAVDHHSGKKAETRGLSWHPSGPLTLGDALEAGRADARRLLRPPPLAASHHYGLLTPPLAVATVARELVSGAASVWLSRCRGSVRVGATADVSWHGANSYSR